jgi:nucleoid-associated protein YgaU
VIAAKVIAAADDVAAAAPGAAAVEATGAVVAAAHLPQGLPPLLVVVLMLLLLWMWLEWPLVMVLLWRRFTFMLYYITFYIVRNSDFIHLSHICFECSIP